MPSNNQAPRQKNAKLRSAKARLKQFQTSKVQQNGSLQNSDTQSVTSSIPDKDISPEIVNNHDSNLSERKNAAVLLQYQQQIQLQMQSIHHLVAEKEELVQNITVLEKNIKQTSENQSSSTQSSIGLKQKYDGLQREHTLTREAKSKFQNASEQLERELDTLNESYKRVLARNEELYERNSELSHQLNTKSAELASGKKELSFINQQKNSLETKIKQHKSSIPINGHYSEKEADRHKEEKDQLQEQIKEINASLQLYKKTVNDLTKERQTLLGQITQINSAWQSKLENIVHQRDKALADKHAANLQSISNDEVLRIKDELDKKSRELETEIQLKNHTKSEYESIIKEKQKLSNRLDAQVTDNETLIKLNMEQSDKLTEVGAQVLQLKEQVSDRRELLTSAENERSTLQRALQQNKQLKSQFAELQEALIQTNNTKAEAITQIETLKHHLQKNTI